MNLKISYGNKFAIVAIFVLFLFLFLEVIFREKIILIPKAENILTIQKIALLFFAVLIVVYLIIFRTILFKNKVTLRSFTLFTLFLMLISTVLSLKLSTYLTALFFITTLIYGIKSKHFKIHPLFYFAFGYYIFQLIGLTWTINFVEGFKYIGKGLSYLLLPLAFSFFIITTEERNLILRTFFRFLMVYVFMCIIAYLFQVLYIDTDYLVGFALKKHYFGLSLYPLQYYDMVAGWSGYSHPTFISFILCLMLGVGFYLWKNEKHLINRISNFEILFYAFLSFLLIIFLQSRIGMILMPVSIFLIVLYNFRKQKLVLIFLLILSLISLVLIYLLFIKDHLEYFVDPIRIHQTDIVVSYIKNHFWLGTGTGGMKIINQGFPTAHNQLLGELFHLGIGGLIVFLALFLASFYYGIKNKNYILLYFMILITLLMQIDMPFSVQKGITYFTLFIGLFIRPKFFTNRRRKLIHKHDSNSLSLDL